jgi:hypothetical protein
MEIGQLYQLVLLLVMVGMILGVGIVVLANFMGATGVTGTAAAAPINATINALAPIATTWLSLIVTVSVLAIILTLVIRSFSGGGRK